jgi:type IV secretion system protein VirB8
MSRKQEQNTYFKQAKSWSDDVYGSVVQSRNRYQAAFISMLLINAFAMLAVVSLAHRQVLTPLLIHHYSNGITTAELMTKDNAPRNQAQVESDLLRYLSNRESYEVAAYSSQYALVSLLSNEAVASQYSQEQAQSFKDKPNTVGEPPHHNLAEIVFTLTDRDKATGHSVEKQFTALIGWEYTTPPTDPGLRWQNWDGFLVTSYSKQARNI